MHDEMIGLFKRLVDWLRTKRIMPITVKHCFDQLIIKKYLNYANCFMVVQMYNSSLSDHAEQMSDKPFE